MNASTTTITSSESVEPKCQSLDLPNWFWMMSPMSGTLPPPMSWLMTNVVTAGTKTIVMPSSTPGME